MVRTIRPGCARFHAAIVAAAVCGLLASTPAAAVVSIAATSTNVTFGYDFTASGSYDVLPVANTDTSRVVGTVPGQASQIAADWTSTIDGGGNFYFLSNVRCFGTCAMTITTNTTLTLANSDDIDADVRIDSLILPGHIGIQGNPTITGSYTLTAGDVTGASGMTGQVLGILNDVTGQTRDVFSNSYSNSANETSSYYDLNSFSSYASGKQRAVDFGATNFSLDVTVPASLSVTIGYTSTLVITSTATCADFEDCSGVQVVFGDPRNSGGTGIDDGGGGVSFLRARFAPQDETTPIAESVVDRQFGAYQGRYIVSDATDPLPDPQPAVDPPLYIAGPFAASVPEAPAWAMMLAGFGLVGAAIRRQGAAGFRLSR